MSISPHALALPTEPHKAMSVRAKALLFQDPDSQALLQRIERIARSSATVLIVGETGTGKELVARHVHQASGRRGPFVAVNCGAFPDGMIDVELFGHEVGAYTGASGSRAGWFEAAHGGTLFLDEIGDLPLAMQVRLLRVLQERQVVRLGARKPVDVDVRLLAATHIDLREAVQAQRFRADLYYRLSVAPLSLPPLRERTADILPLAEHFLEMYAAPMGLKAIRLGEDARAALLAYPWPGNIRELENAVHFGLIVCKDEVIRATDLKLLPASSAKPSNAGPATFPSAIFDALNTHFTGLARSGAPNLFHSIEAILVGAIYTHCGESQVRSARVLGVTRNTLRTLLKRHGLLGIDAPLHAESSARSA